LRPSALHPLISTSNPLPLLPVLAQSGRSKPAGGWWLRQGGWHKYLQGQTLAADDLVHGKDLWSYDERIGIGLQASTRSAADGKLFASRGVAMKAGVGFAVAASGASLPTSGSLRLGGDGRAVQVHHATITWPNTDVAALCGARRCRIVLTSPGIFAEGWRLPGMDADGRLTLPGLTARVVAAAVNRADTISGWDLAQRQPKTAVKAAGSGSVYWLDELQTTPEALGKLVAHGLWGERCEDTQRRAEGFNRMALAVWN
jgi:CRISPR-associated protein Cmr3